MYLEMMTGGKAFRIWFFNENNFIITFKWSLIALLNSFLFIIKSEMHEIINKEA